MARKPRTAADNAAEQTARAAHDTYRAQKTAKAAALEASLARGREQSEPKKARAVTARQASKATTKARWAEEARVEAANKAKHDADMARESARQLARRKRSRRTSHG